MRAISFDKMKTAVSAVLAVILMTALAIPAQAGGLTVSGGKIETTVVPGSPSVHSMTVINTGDTPMDVAIEAKGYGTTAGNIFTALEPDKDTSPYSAREYLEIDPAEFHLEPGDSREVKVTVNTPADMGEGGRYAVVFIHTLPSGSGAVATVSAVAARVLLTNAGAGTDHESEIGGLSVKSGKDLTAGFTVFNQGNHHYKPAFQAVLKRGSESLAAGSLSDAWPLIPGYERGFSLKLDAAAPLEPGEYSLEIEARDESGAVTARHSAPYTLTGAYTPPAPTTTTAAPTAAGSTVTPTAARTAAPTSAEVTETPTRPDSPLLFGIIGALAVLVLVLTALLLRKRR